MVLKSQGVHKLKIKDPASHSEGEAKEVGGKSGKYGGLGGKWSYFYFYLSYIWFVEKDKSYLELKQNNQIVTPFLYF